MDEKNEQARHTEKRERRQGAAAAFWRSFDEIRGKTTLKQLEMQAGLPSGTLANQRRQLTPPDLLEMLLLSDALRVSLDTLAGRESLGCWYRQGIESFIRDVLKAAAERETPLKELTQQEKADVHRLLYALCSLRADVDRVSTMAAAINYYPPQLENDLEALERLKNALFTD